MKMFTRRGLLRAGLGAVGAAILAACSKKTPSSTGTPTTPAARSTTPAATSTPTSALNCVATPAETEGPFFVDEMLNRSDIRSDPSNGAVSPGALLTVNVRVFHVNGSTCLPLEGARVDVWHADAGGVYSDVGSAQGRKFLRGYQITDPNGSANFTTVYPGWYQGRTVHIHFKVRTFSGTQRTFEFTSQWFFDDLLSDQVYASAPYNARGTRDQRNATDGIYANSGSLLLLPVTKNGQSYVGTFDIGLTAV